MSPRTCDHCGATFDPTEWHPVAVGGSDGALHEFCSEDCKRTFLETTAAADGSRHADGADSD